MLLKKYSDFGGGKKIQSFCHLLFSGKKICDKKKKNSNSCVVGKKNS